MNLSIEKHNDVAVVLFPEPFLDTSNHEEFMREITPILQENTKVILDIGPLQTVDSSGLGAFAYCLRKTRDAGGGLRIACVAPTIQAAFKLVHIERIIGVHNTVAEAIEAFSAG